MSLSWEARYQKGLRAWLDGGGEAALEEAYLAGREAVNLGVGMVDFLLAHRRATASIQTDPHSEEAWSFLVEAAAPFEMALRGYQDANLALRDMNARLEARVRQRTASLEALQERYRNLVERLPGVVYETDADGALSYVSPRFQELLPGQELVRSGPGWLGHVSDEDANRVRQQMARALAGAGDYQLEYRLKAGGERIWVRDYGRVEEEEGRRVLRGILLDVTREKQLREQLLRAQRSESLGRMAAGIAHDFNNLLQVITGYGEQAIRSLPDDAQAQRDLHEVLQAARSAANLTRQLLAYAREQPLQPRPVEMGPLLQRLASLVRPILGEDVELTMDVEPELPRVEVDPGQMEQVLMNLVLNACDAMPKGGELRIRARARPLTRGDAAEVGLLEGAYVTTEVTDTGVGMPEEVQAHIFEPFFTTKEPGRGTGLGLATSYVILAQHRGTITMESQPGKGSTFTVWLPAAA